MVGARKSEGPKSAMEILYDVYSRKILPLEAAYKYGSFYTLSLSENEIMAKPIVLLIGQYSTGKTTFIQKTIGRQFPGARIGPEPTVSLLVSTKIVDGQVCRRARDRYRCGMGRQAQRAAA